MTHLCPCTQVTTNIIRMYKKGLWTFSGNYDTWVATSMEPARICAHPIRRTDSCRFVAWDCRYMLTREEQEENQARMGCLRP